LVIVVISAGLLNCRLGKRLAAGWNSVSDPAGHRTWLIIEFEYKKNKA